MKEISEFLERQTKNLIQKSQNSQMIEWLYFAV